MLRRSRPEYPDFIQWLNLAPEANGSPQVEIDPITLLARSGGKRATDHFEVFPLPERNEAGEYQIYFFAHGLSHYPSTAQQRASECTVGEELLLVQDLQNQSDSRALMLRTEDRHIVGFCPRYLVPDLFELVYEFPREVRVVVEKMNPAPTPLQYRLLCKLNTDLIQIGLNPRFQIRQCFIHTGIAGFALINSWGTTTIRAKLYHDRLKTSVQQCFGRSISLMGMNHFTALIDGLIERFISKYCGWSI